MNIFPSFREFIKLAKDGNLVPVYADLMADFETPVSVYSKLNRSGSAFLLESIEGGERLARYSFIGCQPRKTIKAYQDKIVVVNRSGEISTLPAMEDPLNIIEDEMSSYHPVKLDGMPPFIGGAVGIISYEYVHNFESTVPIAKIDPLKFPLLYFMISDTVVIFDRARQTLRLLVNAHIEDDPELAYNEAVKGIKALYNTLQESRTLAPIPVNELNKIEVPPGNITQKEFEALVGKCKKYIRAGDIIQVVGSQRFEREFSLPPLELYRALRTINPSPYMFLYETNEFALVGASPEVHVKLTGDLVEVRPIAGTRPRGKTDREDIAFEQEMLSDEKEKAEHLMLVDLARNDIGRVCHYGSVKVPEYMAVERYSDVMHIVSQVEGILSPDYNAFDLLRATFPAGTVSGAPKIRAMQIIEEMEGERRGPYGGVLGYFSYDGNLDTCIAIRTALLQGNKIYIQSGAGLVADSQPDKEYEETINKAKGMLRAVARAEGMSPV